MLTEWILLDSETDKLRFCRARDQKTAIKTALSYDIVPRKTDDVRPRIAGDYEDIEIMSSSEFNDFMDKLKQ